MNVNRWRVKAVTDEFGTGFGVFRPGWIGQPMVFGSHRMAMEVAQAMAGQARLVERNRRRLHLFAP